jgi:hypothetical protein
MNDINFNRLVFIRMYQNIRISDLQLIDHVNFIAIQAFLVILSRICGRSYWFDRVLLACQA